MFRKAAIVLAITLVSLSAARAEDPDEGVFERFRSAAVHWRVDARHHIVPFSEPKRPFFPNWQMKPNRSPAGKRAMRAALAFGVAIVAALVAVPIGAQAGWCASVTGPDGGFVSCGYTSWQQCQAALSGQGGICYRSPR
jgi:hypothetical protein